MATHRATHHITLAIAALSHDLLFGKYLIVARSTFALWICRLAAAGNTWIRLAACQYAIDRWFLVASCFGNLSDDHAGGTQSANLLFGFFGDVEHSVTLLSYYAPAVHRDLSIRSKISIASVANTPENPASTNIVIPLSVSPGS